MTPDSWRLIFDGVVATIALLGLILSVVSLGYTWWTNRPHVKVILTWAMIGGVGQPMMVITARNLGRVPVRLSSVGVDLKARGETLVFVAPPPFAPPLAHTLEPGHAWSYHTEPGEVLLAHTGTKGPVRGPFVNDEAGRHWSGKTKRSFLDSWVRQRSEPKA